MQKSMNMKPVQSRPMTNIKKRAEHQAAIFV